jgi:hypothetical protein
MKGIFILLATLFASVHFNAQSYFSIIPDFGGDGMAGMAYNVIPLKENIKVIGLVTDSIIPGSDGGDWPIMGSISYDGEYLGAQFLVDSAYADGFIYVTRRIAFKNDSICYLYDRRNIGNMFLDAYLVELNYQEGKIIRSKIVYDEITDNQDFLAMAVTVGRNGNLYLISVTTEYGIIPPILTVLDSGFNVLSQSLIPSFGRRNTPKYVELDNAGNIVMVGMSRGEPTSVWWESKLYRQVLDSNFVSIDFRLAPTEHDQSIILVDHYPIIKGRNGDWVVSSQKVIETPDCQGCSNGIPYVVGIAHDFSEVLWETRMFDGSESNSRPLYWACSITEVDNGYIFSGSTRGAIGNETTGLVGKVGLNGDSLWLKHYIPIGWDTTRAQWFDLKDIKTTPKGNVVACGRSYDRYNQIRVPWILHLDSDGCIDPGCNPTSSFGTLDNLNPDIRIFPNPARVHCSIQVRTHAPSPDYTLKIFDSQGHMVRNLGVAGRDVQFLLDLHGWPSGPYYVQLVNEVGTIRTRKLIVLN